MVITGAGGQVGRFLAAQAPRQGYEVCALTRHEADITDPAAARRHLQRGDLVVNCAALTDVDVAEADPDGAHAANTVGPGLIARACAAAGARLIHLSTDYVFGGELGRPYDITDPTGPLSVYGHSKLNGELAVHAELPDAHVVRTSWVYTGGSGADFVAVMRRLAAGEKTIEVVDDQIGSPTYVRDLVAALFEVAAGDIEAPVLHVANAGTASRFDQARAVFAGLGADPERVRPVGTDAVPRPARRPAYSALSMAASVRAGLTPLRPWREALAEALATPAGGGPIPSKP